MKSFDVFNKFTAQLERRIQSTDKFQTKVVQTPSSVDEKGVVIKVTLLKTTLAQSPGAETRLVRCRVQVSGTAESMTGLEQACSAIESLDAYLCGKNAKAELRLENADGSRIANTRILTTVTADDSFIDSPDSTAVQDVGDDRTVTIYVPAEET
jgi:hypothetical protein